MLYDPSLSWFQIVLDFGYLTADWMEASAYTRNGLFNSCRAKHLRPCWYWSQRAVMDCGHLLHPIWKKAGESRQEKFVVAFFFFFTFPIFSYFSFHIFWGLFKFSISVLILMDGLANIWNMHVSWRCLGYGIQQRLHNISHVRVYLGGSCPGVEGTEA